MFIEYVEKLDSDSILEDDVFSELFALEDMILQADKEVELLIRAKKLGVESLFERKLDARKNYFQLNASKSNLDEFHIMSKDGNAKDDFPVAPFRPHLNIDALIFKCGIFLKVFHNDK